MFPTGTKRKRYPLTYVAKVQKAYSKEMVRRNTHQCRVDVRETSVPVKSASSLADVAIMYLIDSPDAIQLLNYVSCINKYSSVAAVSRMRELDGDVIRDLKRVDTYARPKNKVTITQLGLAGAFITLRRVLESSIVMTSDETKLAEEYITKYCKVPYIIRWCYTQYVFRSHADVVGIMRRCLYSNNTVALHEAIHSFYLPDDSIADMLRMDVKRKRVKQTNVPAYAVLWNLLRSKGTNLDEVTSKSLFEQIRMTELRVTV